MTITENVNVRCIRIVKANAQESTALTEIEKEMSAAGVWYLVLQSSPTRMFILIEEKEADQYIAALNSIDKRIKNGNTTRQGA